MTLACKKKCAITSSEWLKEKSVAFLRSEMLYILVHFDFLRHNKQPSSFQNSHLSSRPQREKVAHTQHVWCQTREEDWQDYLY